MLSAGPDRPLFWRHGEVVTRAAAANACAQVAGRLRAGEGPVVNLCEDRYHFLTGLLAAMTVGRRTLLPPNAAPEAVATLAEHEGATLVLDDARLAGYLEADEAHAGAVDPDGDDRAPRVSLYTSGSTGSPKACHRRWSELVHGARTLRATLGLAHNRAINLVATVPAQHMFGLEASIMLPLVTGAAVDSGRPLFPDDVREALTRLPRPRALVTTPLHLHACLGAELDWPPVAFVLSATAPMPAAVAARAEEVMGAPVHEIFGSTETGALAYRRTLRKESWTPLQGVTLTAAPEGWRARGAHFPECLLEDRLKVADDGSFRVLGRATDMVKIAGKSTSLAELNRQLLAVPGVRDGVVLRRGAETDGRRLLGLVVAPALSVAQIRAALRARVDPIFVPRPLVKVQSLPRNATGKLPDQSLRTLLRDLGLQ